MRRLVALCAVFAMLLAACAGDGSAEAGSESNVAPTITGTALERAQAVADTLNWEADNADDPARSAVRVTYVEIPEHRTADGHVHYGVHFIVMVATDAGEASATNIAENVAGRIFELTTKHVFPTDIDITHMGVEIIESDAWFIGGHDKGSILFYVAGRQDLERVASQALATPQSYLHAANKDEISGSWLQAVLNELRRLQEQEK